MFVRWLSVYHKAGVSVKREVLNGHIAGQGVLNLSRHGTKSIRENFHNVTVTDFHFSSDSINQNWRSPVVNIEHETVTEVHPNRSVEINTNYYTKGKVHRIQGVDR